MSGVEDQELPAPHLMLRAATSECHERVDRAFGRFDLATTHGYRGFLCAHARALPALEAAVAAADPAIASSRRLPLLLADLDAMGVAPPLPLAGPDGGIAGRWGIAYVLEGSRLGGAMLARRVVPGCSNRFLSAAHGPGEWREFRRRLDRALNPSSIGVAADAAVAAFGLYERAASAEDDDR